MKAILVVDIDRTDLKDCRISYVIQDRNKTVLDADTGVKLKPAPREDVYIKRYEVLDYRVCEGIECKKCPFKNGSQCRLRKYFLEEAPSAINEILGGEYEG